MKLKIMFLPPPVALAGIDIISLANYEKLASIISLTDVLKYHRFNTLAKELFPTYCGNDFDQLCYESKNLEFIAAHNKEYEIVCKKDSGKESSDDFYSTSGKLNTVIDVNAGIVFINVFGEGEEDSNIANFLRAIANGYSINNMMSTDTFKKYLIS